MDTSLRGKWPKISMSFTISKLMSNGELLLASSVGSINALCTKNQKSLYLLSVQSNWMVFLFLMRCSKSWKMYTGKSSKLFPMERTQLLQLLQRLSKNNKKRGASPSFNLYFLIFLLPFLAFLCTLQVFLFLHLFLFLVLCLQSLD